MDHPGANPLLSTSKSSDSQLQVQLHPLVILTVSDYVTRHTLRRQSGPIVGAIIGAQNGRELTMEHAFECKMNTDKNGDAVIDRDWFHDRLQQFRDVHKAPALDFVGWFTLVPPSGPQPYHVPIHQQLLEAYNESALLLAFHPSSIIDDTSKGSKLPITIYETFYETSADDGDKHMQSSDEAGPQVVLRFQEIPYTIETGDAEMIGVDFVARGGANATVTNGSATIPRKADAKGKGKARGRDVDRSEDSAGLDVVVLSPEDEELISTLTTKANAIRMLQQRITLMKSYLQSLPPCYLNTPPSSSEPHSVATHPQISHPILRTISSALARLPLLTPSSSSDSPTTASPIPADTPSIAREVAQQRSDVALVSLLGSLGSTILSAQEMGRKAGVVERARFAATQLTPGGLGGGGMRGGKGLGGWPSGGAGNMSIGMGDPPMYQGEMRGGDANDGFEDDEAYYDAADEDMDGRDGGGVRLQSAQMRGVYGSFSATDGRERGPMPSMTRPKREEDEEMT